MKAFFLQPAVERLTVSITLQNLNMTFSHFLCPAGMTVILAGQNIIFISNLYYIRGTQRQFSENICSEGDLRSRIFGTFVVKFLAYEPVLGFSNILKMV